MALAGLMLLPGAALADHAVAVDCAPPPPLDQAVATSEVVFVGTVVATGFEGRSATVQVQEVWRGDIAETVTVDGGQNPAALGEDDRVFDLGVKYIFLPTHRDGRLIDSVCGPTVQWAEAANALRPADAHAPSPVTADGSNPLAFLGDLATPLLTAALVGGGLFLFAMVVGRRRDA